jgi:hypothetical protein
MKLPPSASKFANFTNNRPQLPKDKHGQSVHHRSREQYDLHLHLNTPTFDLFYFGGKC